MFRFRINMKLRKPFVKLLQTVATGAVKVNSGSSYTKVCNGLKSESLNPL